MIEVRFQDCTLRVDHDDYYAETVFDDGKVVPARPQNDYGYRERAKSLGYGVDTWALCLDHEALHTFVGELFGHGHSVVLWNVAHGDPKKWPEWGKQEEGFCMSLALYLNTGERNDLVGGVFNKAFERHGLYEQQVERMIRGLLQEVRQH